MDMDASVLVHQDSEISSFLCRHLLGAGSYILSIRYIQQQDTYGPCRFTDEE